MGFTRLATPATERALREARRELEGVGATRLEPTRQLEEPTTDARKKRRGMGPARQRDEGTIGHAGTAVFAECTTFDLRAPTAQAVPAKMAWNGPARSPNYSQQNTA